MANEYDISKAFKRIENDLMDSMMRNLKRHQAEETEMGFNWGQWQALQLKELERYRKENAKKFGGDFSQINNRIEDLFKQTSADAQAKEEARILDDIRKGKYYANKKDVSFFNVNDQKLDVLIERTKADFSRAEYAVLRGANDQYRKIIFDAQVYGNITNDYAKAVDMATHDYLQNGLQSIQYKGWTDKYGKYHAGTKHNISDYAEMAIRTGNKRAYLMGEGNAHDAYGIHTIRVNKRTQACPKCVGFLGKVMVDDVYAGGTPKEASKLGVPLLSQAIQQGFLHPNCKDIYSMYIPNVSKPADPWTKQEIEDIVGDYNAEQELQHAQDMAESYWRMSKYSLDPENQQRYSARAFGWEVRADEIKAGMPPTPIIPVAPTPPPTPKPPEPTPPVEPEIKPFTDDERDALEWYVSGEGMWINQYMRGIGGIDSITEDDQMFLEMLKSATNRPLEADKLYRSVDASAIFEGVSDNDLYDLMEHIVYGDSKYDKGAYSQNLKKRMESIISKTQGKEITEKGFMSTTVDKAVAENWGDFTDAQHPVVIEFDTKGKKLKGADLDFLDLADDPQRERLLAPNTKYKITDIGVGEYEGGGKYVKIKAEILDEAVEEVAEEVAEVVAPVPQVETAEQKVRAEITQAKARLAEANKNLEAVEEELAKIESAEARYYNTYFISGGFDEAVEKRIKAREEHPTWYTKDDSAEVWRFIRDNKDKLDNFGFEGEKKALKDAIKARKKDIKPIQKELNARYNDLEAIIGEPNTKRLAVYGDKNVEQINHFLDDAPTTLRNIWDKCADNFNVLSNTDRWGKRRKGAYYNSTEDGVWLSINKVAKGDNLHPAYETVFHEYGHNIDYVLNRKIGNGNTQQAFTETYKNGIFGKTIRDEAEKAIVEYGRANGFSKTDINGYEIFDRKGAEKALAKELKDAYTNVDKVYVVGDISDMFESTFSTAYPFGAGHGKSYWTDYGIGKEYIRTGREAFAEMYASQIANNDSWAMIQKYFPESVKIFNEIIEMGNAL